MLTSRHFQFNSLTYLLPLTKDGEEGEGDAEHVVKIFSMAELDDEKLDEIFGEGQVKWIYRKQWDAYPCGYCGREEADARLKC